MTIILVAIGSAMLGCTAAVFILSAFRLAAESDRQAEQLDQHVERMMDRP